jgi:hypothetical protein
MEQQAAPKATKMPADEPFDFREPEAPPVIETLPPRKLGRRSLIAIILGSCVATAVGVFFIVRLFQDKAAIEQIYKEQNVKKAIQMADDYLKSHPSSFAIHYKRAELLSLDKRFRAAKIDAGLAIDLARTPGELHKAKNMSRRVFLWKENYEIAAEAVRLVEQTKNHERDSDALRLLGAKIQALNARLGANLRELESLD